MDYDWASDFVSDDGEVDMESLLAALQNNPELMAQFEGE